LNRKKGQWHVRFRSKISFAGHGVAKESLIHMAVSKKGHNEVPNPLIIFSIEIGDYVRLFLSAMRWISSNLSSSPINVIAIKSIPFLKGAIRFSTLVIAANKVSLCSLNTANITRIKTAHASKYSPKIAAVRGILVHFVGGALEFGRSGHLFFRWIFEKDLNGFKFCCDRKKNKIKTFCNRDFFSISAV